MGHAGEDAGDSTAAEMLKASDRLPIASVMAPVAIGPSVCPTPKEIVHMAIALGQVAGGGVGVLKLWSDFLSDRWSCFTFKKFNLNPKSPTVDNASPR